MEIVASYENVLPIPQADGEVCVSTAFALARRGHEVTLMAPRQAGRPALPVDDLAAFYGCKGPLRYRELSGTNAHVAAQMLAHAAMVVCAAETRAADLVYARNPVVLLGALAAGHRVFFDHYRPWGAQVPPMRPALRWAFTHPNFLGGVTHSQLTRESYLALGAPEERFQVAHAAYEPGRFQPRHDRRAARAALGLAEEGWLVVYTGRVDDSKGLDVVLEAADACQDMRLLLVGARGDSALKRRAEGSPNVEVVGWQSFERTALYLQAADVLIIPPSAAPLSEHGHTVLPLKVFLYLGAGRAIVAPDSPDVREVLRDGQTALLVPPGDVRATVAALRSLRRDQARYAALVEAALADARHHTWDARAERIERHMLERIEAWERARDNPAARHLRPSTPMPVGPLLRDSARWVAGLARGHLVLPA